MVMNIPELLIGIAITLGGIVSILLFMRTLQNLEKESTKYLLIVEAWSAVVMPLIGYNILFLGIEPWTITIVTISLGALMIAASLIIYDNQKIDYTAIKA